MKNNNTNNIQNENENKMNIDELLNTIFSFRVKKRRENIDDLIEIYNLLDKPCSNSKIIHIAGTNGKGSTASFLEQILLASKYNVGKFTSPHILKYNERIIFNNNMILDKDIISCYEILNNAMAEYNKKNNKNLEINFFEITFFIALIYFQSKSPDFLVIEAGLGGRLDATNCITSTIAVITNISFDHTNILGDSLEDIAYEKCDIIKNNQLCVYADKNPILKNEIQKKTTNSFNVLEKYNFSVELDKINFKTIVNVGNTSFYLNLFGKFQANNFLLAYNIAKKYDIDDNTIQKGLDNVYWQARFEVVSKNPVVILDVAHNDDSITKLIETLTELYKKEEMIIITSLLSTKDFSSFFSKIQNISNMIFITSLKDVVFGLTSSEIKENMINNNIDINDSFIFEDNIKTAYNKAISIVSSENSPYKAIVVCGSFYEISNFKSKISIY